MRYQTMLLKNKTNAEKNQTCLRLTLIIEIHISTHISMELTDTCTGPNLVGRSEGEN
jgi:hypothetical protein